MIPLSKQSILNIGAGTGRFISPGLEWHLALDILKWEVVLFVRLHEKLVELRRRLWAQLIARLDMLGWRTLAGHIRSRTVKHGVWPRAKVQATRLWVHEHIVIRTIVRHSWVFNNRKTWLKLIRHFTM